MSKPPPIFISRRRCQPIVPPIAHTCAKETLFAVEKCFETQSRQRSRAHFISPRTSRPGTHQRTRMAELQDKAQIMKKRHLALPTLVAEINDKEDGTVSDSKPTLGSRHIRLQSCPDVCDIARDSILTIPIIPIKGSRRLSDQTDISKFQPRRSSEAFQKALTTRCKLSSYQHSGRLSKPPELCEHTMQRSRPPSGLVVTARKGSAWSRSIQNTDPVHETVKEPRIPRLPVRTSVSKGRTGRKLRLRVKLPTVGPLRG